MKARLLAFGGAHFLRMFRHVFDFDFSVVVFESPSLTTDSLVFSRLCCCFGMWHPFFLHAYQAHFVAFNNGIRFGFAFCLTIIYQY